MTKKTYGFMLSMSEYLTSAIIVEESVIGRETIKTWALIEGSTLRIFSSEVGFTFQGNQPRRRRMASPVREEKEDTISNSSPNVGDSKDREADPVKPALITSSRQHQESLE